jgi:hypothetical protein
MFTDSQICKADEKVYAADSKKTRHPEGAKFIGFALLHGISPLFALFGCDCIKRG